ncbi:MAG: metal-dependent transcriptional regulator [Thermoprotei archaeon]|nr:MAG: metal-dependent transcriptional regulator [Thermoprotei archaeon]RLE99086.1 MAG: metal-dependent transcriptional regulator [Thermoprotei archaeon]
MVSKREEEYLEAIHILLMEKNVVRVKDLARILKVRAPTVVEFLEKLSRKGLVKYEKRELITLTDRGREIAEEIYRRHILLRDFLSEVLGVPFDQAEEDACNMEHSISDETLKRLEKLFEYIKRNPSLLKEIRCFIKSVKA